MKRSGFMRFHSTTAHPNIDAHLQRSKPRSSHDTPLPWGQAMIGLGLVVLMQLFL